MSAIFLSHSSADAKVAAEWKRWLSEDQHHQSIFLDFDPEQGIPAGRDWEGELYRRLRNCRALIVLCSESSMASRWCFVEITLARSLGKPIFPILIEPCDVVEVLNSVQIIDAAEGLDVARQRLSRALGTAGLQSADRFGWDESAGRSPYPGLLAFDEADAGVFFGRDFEIGEGLDRLNQLRRYRGSGLLVVLGAAGSGKSSLVRAGLVPRLKQDEKWVVLPPFRPGNEPRRQLAKVMAAGAPRGSTFDAERFQTAFLDCDAAADAAAELNRGMAEICAGSQNPEARVLVVLDQFEELLGQPADHPAHLFLTILRAALDQEDCVMLVVATMRSDYLGEFQSRPALSGFAYENLTLGPMAPENLRQMIEQPAQLAETQLEDNLVDALLRDADTDYALPLLAFTLHELYASHLDARRTLTLAAYQEQLGGLEGALTKAVERRLPAVMSEDDRSALRKAFLAMARLDEAGRVTRRAVPWSELEELMGGRQRAENLLGPFIEGRLLRSGGIEQGERTVEVTHEALFRNWPDLVKWIREHLGDLKFRDQIVETAAQWTRGGEKVVDLLTHKVRLARALELRDSQRVPMGEELKRYLDASEAFDRKRRAAITLRRRLLVGGALVVALVMAFMWRVAVGAKKRAQDSEEEARAQVSRFLAAETGRQDLDLALLLGIESYQAANTREARDALAAKVYESPQLTRFLVGHEDWVTTLAAPVQTPLLVSRGKDSQVWIWDPVTGRQLHRLAAEGRVINGIAIDREGRLLASTHEDGSATLWELDPTTGSAAPRKGLRSSSGSLGAVALSANGRVLAALGGRGAVHLWTTEDGSQLPAVRPARSTDILALDPSGELLVTGHRDGRLQVWTELPSEPRLAWEFIASERTGGVSAIAFGPEAEGRWAWAFRETADIHLCAMSEDWSLGGGPLGGEPCVGGPTILDGPAKGVADLVFDGGGNLAVAGLDGSTTVWSPSGRRLGYLEQPEAVDAVTFIGDGRSLATGSRDDKIRVWSLDDPAMAQVHDAIIDAIAIDPAGEEEVVVSTSGQLLSRWTPQSRYPEASVATGDLSRVALGRGLIAAGGDNRQVEVWNAGMEKRQAVLETEDMVTSLAISPTEDLIGVGLDNGLVGLWRVGAESFDYSFVMSDSVSAVSFSNDGMELAAGAYDGSLVVWELEGGAPVRETRKQLAEVGVSSVQYATHEPILVVGLESGEVLRRDESGELAPIDGHPIHRHPVISLAFDPTGRFLASGSSLLEVWNLADNALEFTLPLPGRSGEIAGIAFAPDGQSLAVALRRTVWRVPLHVDRWIELACGRANRNLSPDEWRLYLGEQPWRETCSSIAPEEEPEPELGPEQESAPGEAEGQVVGAAGK